MAMGSIILALSVAVMSVIPMTEAFFFFLLNQIFILTAANFASVFFL